MAILEIASVIPYPDNVVGLLVILAQLGLSAAKLTALPPLILKVVPVNAKV